MGNSHELGRNAEARAAAYLRTRGWRIRHANWRCRHKEIDLVAERDGVVAFVEVKARTGTAYGHPLEAIDPRKRRGLAQAARLWVARHGRRGEAYRFDTVSVLATPEGLSVEHTEDAWRL